MGRKCLCEVEHVISHVTRIKNDQLKMKGRALLGDGPTIAIAALLLMSRLMSGFLHLPSCADETFNYLEPLAYLDIGKGLQTWEYSPEFALRPWLFLEVFNFAMLPFSIHMLRVLCLHVGIALLWFHAELRVADAIYGREGLRMANWYMLLSACSPGPIFAASQFLPSTIFAILQMWSVSFFLRDQWGRAVATGVASCLLPGNPIVGLVYVPFLLQCLRRGRLVRCLTSGVVVCCLCFVTMAWMDHRRYGSMTFSIYNWFKYNVLNNHSGRFGSSPLWYYGANFVLNFPLAAPLAAWGWLKIRGSLTTVSTYWIFWLCLFTLQPHKEERFMVPMYCGALICAAYGACQTRGALRFVTLVAGVLGCLAGVSRCSQLYHGSYLGIRDVWTEIAMEGSTGVYCLGRTWYRYPSSFYLPTEATVAFVDKDFGGLLPAPFTSTNSSMPANDRNERREDRLVSLENCDYLVDITPSFQLSQPPKRLRPLMPVTRRTSVERCGYLLDRERSVGLQKHFLIPHSPNENWYHAYCQWRLH